MKEKDENGKEKRKEKINKTGESVEMQGKEQKREENEGSAVEGVDMNLESKK